LLGPGFDPAQAVKQRLILGFDLSNVDLVADVFATIVLQTFKGMGLPARQTLCEGESK